MWIVYYLCVTAALSSHLNVCPTKPSYCFGETCGVHLAGVKLRPGCTCTEQDYAHTTTLCDDTTHTRNIIFYWRPPATCRGGVDLPAPIIGVPCDLDCGPGRFLNYNMTAEDQTVCDNCCLGVGLCNDLPDGQLTGSCCPADSTCCSLDQTDNAGTFTCCQFGTMCENGDCVDVSLDPQESRLLRCQECPPGRSSLGGGLVFDPPWVDIPPQFSVECESKIQGSCYPWRSDDSGQFLETGDNWDIHSSTSVLRLEIETVKQGQISFSYKYDAEERFDVLGFFIDSERVFVVDHVVSEWQSYNHSLEIGMHTFEWVYVKDISASKGQDKAFLKSIEVLGVVSNDLQCDLCSPGRYMANNGARECLPCPAGTHSSQSGALECTPCHPWERSKEGAASCSPDVHCTIWDTYQMASPCINGSQNVTSAWLQPVRCAMQDKAQNGEAYVGPNSETNGTVNVSVQFFVPFSTVPRVFDLEPKQEYYVFSMERKWDDYEVRAENITTKGFILFVERVNNSDVGTWGQTLKVKWSAESNQGYGLPQPFSQSCNNQQQECEQGRQKNISSPSYQCEYCPVHTAGVRKGVCEECIKGGEGGTSFVSVVESFFNCGVSGKPCGDWTFETSCQGECGTPGWRFGEQFVDSGAGHNPGAKSSLTLDVSHTPEAQITAIKFDMLLSCSMMTARLIVLLDEEELIRYDCTGCETLPQAIDLTVLREARQGERSDHRLTWVYAKLAEGDTTHACDVARISNVKIISDYAPVARSSFTGATLCLPCRPGYAGIKGLCEPCASGAFSNVAGGEACTVCEAGKFAYKRGSTTCLNCGMGQISNSYRSACVETCRLSSHSDSSNSNNNNSTNRDIGLQYDIATLGVGSVSVLHEINNENISGTIFISPCHTFRATTITHPATNSNTTTTTITTTTTTATTSNTTREPKLALSAPSQCGRLNEWEIIEEDDEVDNSNLAVPSHVCVALANGRVFSAGGIKNIQMSPPDFPEASYRLSYTAGVISSALSSQCMDGDHASTTITFICDQAQGRTGLIQDISTPRELLCARYQLIWRTSHACHICTKNDMNVADSACLPNGFRNRTFFFNQPQTCLNLGNLPEPARVPCDPLAGVADTHFVLSRIVGYLLLGILIVLILAIVGLEVRHRMLYSKYRSLNVEVQLADGARVFAFNEGDLPASAADDNKRDSFSSDSGEDI